jgi:hypothetical protein
LPRTRQEYQLDEAECKCPACGQQRDKIGEEISEQLDYHPSSLFVVEHVRLVILAQRFGRGLPNVKVDPNQGKGRCENGYLLLYLTGFTQCAGEPVLREDYQWAKERASESKYCSAGASDTAHGLQGDGTVSGIGDCSDDRLSSPW